MNKNAKEEESPSPLMENQMENDTNEATEKSQRKRHGARNQHKMKFFLRWLMETFPSAMAASSLPRPDSDDNKNGSSSVPTDSDSTIDHFFNHPLILDVAGGKVRCLHFCR